MTKLNTQKLADLLPCPFCGGRAEIVDELLTFHSMCTLCGATGSVSSYLNGALDSWNRRSQPVVSQWLPIESAPKDGTEVLLFGRDCVTYGSWSEPSSIPRLVYQDGFAPEHVWEEFEPYWASADGGFTEEHPPTHWQPLPPPPQQGEPG